MPACSHDRPCKGCLRCETNLSLRQNKSTKINWQCFKKSGRADMGTSFFVRATLALSCIGTALIAACGGGGGGSGEASNPGAQSSAPAAAVSGVVFFPETSVPLLLRFNTEGTEVTLFGQKAADGSATQIDGMYFGAGGPGSVSLKQDPTGKPISTTLADGSTIKFDWQSGSAFVATVVSPDGSSQANVSLDTAPSTSKSAISIANQRSARKGVSLSSIAGSQLTAAALSTSGLNNATVEVTVTSAGDPLPGATVWANIASKTAGTGYNLPLGETSVGKYQASFVNFPSAIPPGTVEDACNKIVGTTTTSCTAMIPVATYMVSVGCIQLAAALPPGAPAILGVCEAGFGSALAACTGIKAFVPTGTQQGMCHAIESSVSFFDPDGATIKATASKDGQSGSATQDFAGNVSVASLTIDLPANCKVTSFSTSPVDPGPQESYLATAVTTCKGSNTSVSLSVVGTDGYTDSRVCTAQSTCSLSVPGGAGGVHDTVTVNTSTGESRVVGLVF
jgi:hypothetical protein